MDPYKLLGVSEKLIKHESDLVPVRRQAKKLYKRYTAEKSKFDAKKVLEAFDLIKKRLKGEIGKGEHKLIGRSRMERMMDKHYNHQTKEIKKDKRLKKKLKKMRKGDDVLHLPGDKERVPTGRGLKIMKQKMRRKRRRRDHRSSREKKKKQVETLSGLQRLSFVLPQKGKFGKAIVLLQRWMKEYMNQENRQYIFEVLQDVIDLDFLVENPDSRQTVLAVFEYALKYYGSWFERGDNEKALSSYWRIASEVAVQCFTDDAFILVKAITRLNETLALLEAHRDDLKDGVRFEDDNGGTSEAPAAKVRKLTKLVLIMSPSPLPSPGSDVKDEDGSDVKEEEEGSDVKEEDSDDDELDAAVKTELKSEAAAEDVKQESLAGVREDLAKPVGVATTNGRSKPGKLVHVQLPEPAPSPAPIALDDSDDEGVKKEIKIDSEDDSVKDEEISLSDCSLQDEEISLSSGSSDDDDVEVMSDVEDVLDIDDEEDVFPVPPMIESLYKLRVHYVDRCLATLFARRGPLWARPKIDAFFQDLFYRRSVFAAPQRIQIEAWQSRIKTMQKNGERDVGEANNPLEAHVPIVDSRETRFEFGADSNAWAAKQTFDAREVCGGRNVIR